jgi:Uma2 family endonuclease
MQIPAPLITLAEYLETEERAQTRHEYACGCVYPLATESREHHLLVSNLSSLAWHARATRSCRLFTQSTRLRVFADDSVYYPDLVGSCDPVDGVNGYLERPCFVIEVRSPSSARVDRNEKRDVYLTIPTLEEYVTVDQSRMHVVVYRRAQGREPSEVLRAPDAVLKLSCFGVGIELRNIYEGVEFLQPELVVDVY